MPKYYLMIKRNKAKTWEVAIPVKKGVSKVQAQKSLKTGVRKGYKAVVVDEKAFKAYVAKRGKAATKRRAPVKRRKTPTRKRTTKKRAMRRKK
jgi:hypothetical protein